MRTLEFRGPQNARQSLRPGIVEQIASVLLDEVMHLYQLCGGLMIIFLEVDPDWNVFIASSALKAHRNIDQLVIQSILWFCRC